MKAQDFNPISPLRVSVVIAARNAGAYLFKSLQSLYQSSYKNVEVVVVDDCSTDESRQIAARFPCRLIPLAERCGPGKARNIGVDASSGEIIFFTDADVMVCPGTIEQVANFFNANPDIDAVLGCYTKEIPGHDFVSNYKNLLHHFVHQRSAGPVAGFFTACGAIRRGAFEKVGGFDESVADCSLEDLELGMRLHRRGGKIALHPEIQVTHLKRYTLCRLLYADFRQRAIPYTIHMLRHGIFPDQLSTTKADRASVFVVFLSLLLLAGGFLTLSVWGFAAAATALGLMMFINWRFYSFLLRQKGLAFLIKGIAMQTLTYLMSGVGFIIGAGLYVLRRNRKAAIAPDCSARIEAERNDQGALATNAPGPPTPATRLQANPYILSVTPHQPPKPDPKLVRMAFNENPAGPSPLALEAVRKASLGLNYYPDSRGSDLKQALAIKHGLEPENILLGQGASEVLEIITRAFLSPGDEIIIPEPTFPYYRMLGQLSGCPAITVPLRNHTVDLPALCAAVTPKTKMIFIANPNNPTGTIVGQREIDSFIRGVPEEVLLVFDEAYIDYVMHEKIDTLRHLRQRPMISVRTFSKVSGLAGSRIGYGMADSFIIDTLSRLRRPYNTCALAQAAALACLSDDQHLQKTRQMVSRGRSFLCQQFDRLGFDYVPSQTNFILVDMHADAGRVTEELRLRGFLVRPMPPTSLRVSVGTQEQNQGFIRELEEILEMARPPREAASLPKMTAIPKLKDAFQLRGDFSRDYTDQPTKS
jgi:histidinol-phosphate aminotransferase